MKKLSLALSLLYGTTMLHGCSSIMPESRNWTIEPIESVQHATNRPDGYYQLGRYYQGQNRLELAAGAYRKALALDPTFFEAHNGLGTLYASQGKYAEALAAFNSAIATAPGAAHVHNNIGYLNLLENRYDDAIASFTRATVLDPASHKARNNLNTALARNAEPRKSNPALAKAVEVARPAQPAPDTAPVRVEPAIEARPAAPALPEPTRPALVDHASAGGPARDQVGRVDADVPREDTSPSTGSHAQVATHIPFAVIGTPNASAMPIVVVNGSPYSATETVTAPEVQPRPLEEKPAPVADSAAPAGDAVPVTVAETAESSTQGTLNSPQRADVTAPPSEAISSNEVRNAAIPEERRFVLEVSNGNGINRLAAKVSSILTAKGLPKAALSNQRPFNQAQTVIHYRKGYRAEAARLSRQLSDVQQSVVIVESRNLPARTDVKLVLGKDLYARLDRINQATTLNLASR